MSPIVVGCLCFGLLLLADLAELRRRVLLRRLALGAAILLFLPSLLLLALAPGRLGLSPLPRAAGGLLALLALLLLLRSLVLELRTGRRGEGKAGTGGAEGPKALVSDGSYALCRHPGVLEYLGFHLGLCGLADSRGLLLALPFWAAAEIGAVFIEDRLIFPRLFGEAYLDYQRRVPFLIPGLRPRRRREGDVASKGAAPAGDGGSGEPRG